MLNIKNLNAFVYVNFLIINVRTIKENAHSNVLLIVIIFQKNDIKHKGNNGSEEGQNYPTAVAEIK